ncbi:RNA polymerase sigma factor [Ktedonobacter racemifer]|uniref:RNA polymerase, sigma-24 subunit, ECF subfamily n=1 Tax=Ktedonobacter racemifer DSM 44963 TaxID=485913 RepID=D6TWG5_KTERA|nr:sigma-70 family RNA polymerase sigma factor [Ktedonobacter racemifer]EFH84548.1 RNA polymerase, sigma-24 subunit, ECF subfamily [Ktedonobacter racemifer DSM 44963]
MSSLGSRQHQALMPSSLDMPDAVLAQQALAGNQLAFEAMVQRYQKPLFNFIYKQLGDYDQACDVLQHVLLRFATFLPLLERNRSFKSWLFRVARNCCVDELRRRSRHALPFSQVEVYEDVLEEQSILLEIPDQRPSPEEMAERRETQLLLQEAIGSLPPTFRAIVWLRYAYQPSFAEIGKVLNMPAVTVSTYFRRAKVLLRQRLETQV